MIQLSGIRFAYGDRSVLDIAELQISGGQITGILGPNGAGKTTLLKLIGGILSPQRGDISILGKPRSQLAQKLLAQTIAYVPQETPGIFPMRALDMVLLGRLPFANGFGFATAADRSIAEAAMRDCDAWEFRNRFVGELSGGERQRVILARALAQTPRILLLDEPTTFLDIRHQADVLRVLRHWIAATGGTVVAVFHDLNLAAQICHRVVLLKGGSVLDTGATDTTLSQANVRSTFDADVHMGVNNQTGRPYFIPV